MSPALLFPIFGLSICLGVPLSRRQQWTAVLKRSIGVRGFSRRSVKLLSLHIVTVFVVFLSTAMSLQAQDGRGPRGTLFFPEDYYPISLATLQAPEAFYEHLARLDANTHAIDDSKDWISFTDADLWVFFLKSPSDQSMVPEMLRTKLDESRASTEANLFLGFATKSGREIAASFYFMDRFGDSSVERISCTAALFVFEDLVLLGEAQRAAELGYCEQL